MDRATRFFILCAGAIFARQAAAEQPAALVATNLRGVFAFAAPPAGFDVLSASADQLAAYGYPPRPARVNARAYDFWLRAIRAERHRIIPVLQQTPFAAGAALHAHGTARPGTSTSKNWSATMITNAATRYGTGSFHAAAGWFNIPAVIPSATTCDANGGHLFSWVGLDGWLNNEVFQAGTESDAWCANGVPQAYYAAWYEWYPSLSVRITNLPVNSGDAMVVWMTATSATTGTAWVTNVTNGTSAAISFAAPSGISLVGNSAEWVQERPYWNKVLAMLPNYGGAWMSAEGALLLNDPNIYNYGSPGTNTPFLVTMLDNTNLPISYPTPLGGSATFFMDEGSAK